MPMLWLLMLASAGVLVAMIVAQRYSYFTIQSETVFDCCAALLVLPNQMIHIVAKSKVEREGGREIQSSDGRQRQEERNPIHHHGRNESQQSWSHVDRQARFQTRGVAQGACFVNSHLAMCVRPTFLVYQIVIEI